MLQPDATLPDIVVDTPTVHRDTRGSFAEWFAITPFTERCGHPFALEQANISVSTAGVIRGLHFSDVPPGQAKWVHCAHGDIVDVIVDIRVGSPRYGTHTTISLSADNRRSVYIPEGFAHGFAAITDATVVYLTSAEYDPAVERTLSPFDDQVGIDWPIDRAAATLSSRDEAARSLAELKDAGLLPLYDDCVAVTESLTNEWMIAAREADLADGDIPGHRS